MKDSAQILTFPGDKSIAHRLVLISLLIDKKIKISNLPNGQDVLASLAIVKQLGIEVNNLNDSIVLCNKFKRDNNFGSVSSPVCINCKNSGTTARLLCGILANLNGYFKLIGDSSLSARPMERVVKPLCELMQVDIKCTENHLPVYIHANGHTKAVNFENLTGSAQVKSAILFAGLASDDVTNVVEKIPSRDHTERLLKYIELNKNINELDFYIPGDVSSAAYFIVLAAITGKNVSFKNILLNPTRIGFLNVLKRMGIQFRIDIVNDELEPYGNLQVCGGDLIATDINKEEIPSVIDELPVLAIAMAFAKGKSTVSGASELRVKESDRISCLISQLQKVEVNCNEKADGYEIIGGGCFKSAELDSFNDHRLAMSFAIMAKASNLFLDIKNKDCVDISFPEFWQYINL